MVAAHRRLERHAVVLSGRHTEVEVLDRVIEAVRSGESRALVIRGEAGVGKTALLEYTVERASACRVERTAGVQSEMELAFAASHQLLAPMLDRLDRLPAPQRDALRTAFGVSAGSSPDPFLVAVAVLSLLSDVAEVQPLICVVDDEQWLDRASAQVLAFVARRHRDRFHLTHDTRAHQATARSHEWTLCPSAISQSTVSTSVSQRGVGTTTRR